MAFSERFLLKSELAVRLYGAVRDLPVIDPHDHLAVADLVRDRRYADLTELWVGSDPYKHRAMRICGIPEKYITGEASAYEKFLAWSRCLPELAGNPLYDWSRLELLRVFGIEDPLDPSTAESIWNKTCALLKDPAYSARGLLKLFRVEYAFPCVGLSDDLAGFGKVPGLAPSLRGDDLVGLTHPVLKEAGSLADLRTKLAARLREFHACGCRFSDHAVDDGFRLVPDDGRNEERFARFRLGQLADADRFALASQILRILGNLYARLGWTLQLHIGALRRTSSRLRAAAGPAGGYAAIGSSFDAKELAGFLDELERGEGGLPRVILYTLNPADHAVLAVLSGSFTGDGVRGKVVLGPAWWYCDHIPGMRDALENIAAFGVLSVFPGMTTDSRSLLSFVRHEYFRRVFCNWLAEKSARDEMPSDFDTLKSLAEKVCYHNAKALI